jgi:hypothetical protein
MLRVNRLGIGEPSSDFSVSAERSGTKAEFCALLGLSSRWGSRHGDNRRWEVNGSEGDPVLTASKGNFQVGHSGTRLTGPPNRLRMKSLLRADSRSKWRHDDTRLSRGHDRSRQTRLMSWFPSTGLGAPRLATYSIARPTYSVVVTYFGKSNFHTG